MYHVPSARDPSASQFLDDLVESCRQAFEHLLGSHLCLVGQLLPASDLIPVAQKLQYQVSERHRHVSGSEIAWHGKYSGMDSHVADRIHSVEDSRVTLDPAFEQIRAQFRALQPVTPFRQL